METALYHVTAVITEAGGEDAKVDGLTFAFASWLQVIRVHTNICVCAYKYMCVCAYKYMCVCVHTNTCVCVCVHTNTCVYAYKYMYVYNRSGGGQPIPSSPGLPQCQAQSHYTTGTNPHCHKATML